MSKRINSQDKSSNPNNKDCSACRQALLDLKIAGFPNDILDQLIDYAVVIATKKDSFLSIYLIHTQYVLFYLKLLESSSIFYLF